MYMFKSKDIKFYRYKFVNIKVMSPTRVFMICRCSGNPAKVW